MGQNAMEIKEKILAFLRRKGPSLPVHISKETGLSILFASAFLSELVAEKIVGYSDMKVGSSPVYFLNEQAYMLERFGNHLKSREKDAFLLLKEKKFLADSEQTPQIRVALRAIKDFAVPFSRENQVIWRYYTVPESEFKPDIIAVREKAEESHEIIPEIGIIKEEKAIEIIPEEIEKPFEIRIEKLKESGKEQQKELDIFEKPRKAKAKKHMKKKKAKMDDNLFNKVKEWVVNNSMEIIDIRNFSMNEMILKVRKGREEHMLVVYNKKRLSDSDLVRANRKAREAGLGYSILSLGEPQKKMNDMIDAVKNLGEIRKIE
jgi:hypothetical protein